MDTILKIRVTADEKERLADLAKEQHRSMADLAREAIEKMLDEADEITRQGGQQSHQSAD